MFNIFEGNEDEKAAKLQERLEILKRAREDGFFDEERIEPMPEIVADRHGPDDRKRPSPFVKKQPGPTPPEANVADPTHKYYISQPCDPCDAYTRHISYGAGTLVWHCTICCTCDMCMETVEHPATGGKTPVTDRERAREQVVHGRQALYDAVTNPDDHLFFCTYCGAGLRCSVCSSTGTDRYCDLCGRKDTGEGFCTDCWKEADLDG